MCPLRLILIFLSATLAGFFVLRTLKTRPEEEGGLTTVSGDETQLEEEEPLHSKIRSALRSGFWTCVDMASGRYLWRHLVTSPLQSASKKTC